MLTCIIDIILQCDLHWRAHQGGGWRQELEGIAQHGGFGKSGTSFFFILITICEIFTLSLNLFNFAESGHCDDIGQPAELSDRLEERFVVGRRLSYDR